MIDRLGGAAESFDTGGLARCVALWSASASGLRAIERARPAAFALLAALVVPCCVGAGGGALEPVCEIALLSL